MGENDFFSEISFNKICMKTQKTKQSWKRRLELEGSGSLTSEHTTKYRSQNSILLAQKTEI